MGILKTASLGAVVAIATSAAVWGIFSSFTWILIGVVALLSYAYSSSQFTYWSSKGVQTPPVVPFLGHLHKLMTPKVPRWLFIDEYYNKFSDSKFFGLYEFFKPILVVYDTELVKNILIKDFHHFVDRRTLDLSNGEDRIMNDMLVNATGNHWKGIRSVMSPTFSSGKMKTMFPLVSEKAVTLVAYIKDKAVKEPVMKYKELFGRYTMDVISSCAFGIECNSIKNDDAEFPKRALKMMDLSFSRMAIVFIKTVISLYFPWLHRALKIEILMPGIHFFKDVIVESLESREKGGKRGDFLDLMLESRADQENAESKAPKYPLSDDTIIAECVLFILAGFDTTANTLGFCAYLLSKHPEVQQRLRDEVQGLIKEEGQITYQGVMEAKYLDAVIYEVLRLYPPAHFLERKCTQEYTIPGENITITKDTIVSVPVYSLHRDPRYWQDPEAFNPDRFLPDKSSVVSGSFMPFGLGPRNCIAMRFALMETKVMLAYLVNDVSLGPTPGHEDIEFEFSLGIMKSKKDIILTTSLLSEE